MATPIPKNEATFTHDAILRATGGAASGDGAAPSTFTGVFSDSRAVTPGAIFVALRGESHDGHAFLDAAVAKGARALVVDRAASYPGVAVFVVPDTLVALGQLAGAHLARWRGNENESEKHEGGKAGRGARAERRVVAITGSAGKTTTKEITAALLGACGSTLFTAGNLNNRIGVPSVVLGLEDGHRFAVLEMGMSLPGELDAIASFARPDIAIVTNVGVAHAEGVGGREGVMREKGAVYRALDEDGVAIINADDDFARRAAEPTKAKTRLTFGLGPSDYRLVKRETTALGSRVTIEAKGRTLAVTLPIPGEAAAIDLAAALAAQEAATGALLSEEAIDRALGAVRLDGRARVVRLGRGVVLLDDTYNANPASMRSALSTLAEIATSSGAGRRIAVLGEMKELGPLAEAEHEALGDVIADAGVDLAFSCGGLASLALARAKGRGVETVALASAADAAIALTARIQAGDAILVKGSRSVGAEVVVAKLTETLPYPSDSAPSRAS